ncbi:hypothetical protein A2U01_0045870, partial [Trifolium medium]|nr:hypothetical protein [Trifolium medium]
ENAKINSGARRKRKGQTGVCWEQPHGGIATPKESIAPPRA